MLASRRSRIKRTRTGKQIAFTARDLAIFHALARYRYLRSTYLRAFVGGASETRFKERLGDLFHEGFIERPLKQWEFAEARCVPTVYEIGKRARHILSEHADGEQSATFLAPTAHRQFSHSVMICECIASIELATRLVSGLRFISWPEILARAPEGVRHSTRPFQIPLGKNTLIPDGIFGIEYALGTGPVYRFFALEADRGTMPITRTDGRQTSLGRKLEAYRDAIGFGVHRSQLGVPNLLVLTVTTEQARLRTALERLGSTGAAAVLFKMVSPMTLKRPTPDLLSESWQRAGFPPLRIDAPR